MSKYRKKPVVIEAVQWNGAFVDPIPSWLAQAASKDHNDIGAVWRDGNELVIVTLEGEMTAAPNDWIICGVKGEIYSCKPDIFEMTYEQV
jgi:hypothetical protein